MDSENQWHRPLSYDIRSVTAEASDDSTGPHLVSAVPLDDLSTLGDTFTGGGRGGGAAATAIHISNSIFHREHCVREAQNIASRVPNRAYVPPTNRMVYLSPESLFKDDLADGEDTTITDDQQENSTKSIYKSPFLYGLLLLGLIAGLAWRLSRSGEVPVISNESRLPGTEPPPAAPTTTDSQQTTFPTIVYFDSPVAPPNTRPSLVTGGTTSVPPSTQPVQPQGPIQSLPPVMVMLPPTKEPSVGIPSIISPTATPVLIMSKRPSPPYTPGATPRPTLGTFQPAPILWDHEYFGIPFDELDARDFPPDSYLLTRSPILQYPSERLTASPRNTNTDLPTLTPTSESVRIPTTDTTTDESSNQPTEEPTLGEPSRIQTDEPVTNKPSSMMPHFETSSVPPSSIPIELPIVPTPTPSLESFLDPTLEPTTRDPSPYPTTLEPAESTRTQSPQPSPNLNQEPIEPTRKPSPNPTSNPTGRPIEPTRKPSPNPTENPIEPTLRPSPNPTEKPIEPTLRPSPNPTEKPIEPTRRPSPNPTEKPIEPTLRPSPNPTEKPIEPTRRPTPTPTEKPIEPTRRPSPNPTEKPIEPT